MLHRLRRASVERGLLGGSTPWVVLGGVLWALRGLRLVSRRETGVIWRGELREGESLVIGSRKPS